MNAPRRWTSHESHFIVCQQDDEVLHLRACRPCILISGEIERNGPTGSRWTTAGGD